MKRKLELPAPPWPARRSTSHPAGSNGPKQCSGSSQPLIQPELCPRCSTLDILKISTRRPHSIDPYSNMYPGEYGTPIGSSDEDRRPVEDQNLGPANILLRQEDCALCRFLYAILPSHLQSSSKDVYLLSSLAIHRFEPTVRSWYALGDGSSGDVTYLYLATRSGGSLPLADSAENAFTHMQGSMYATDMGMLASKVDPVGVNVERVTQWIEHCVKNHGGMCNYESSPELCVIRLIDVHQRRIVEYQRDYQYLCLSYVWGKTSMPRIDMCDELPPLPSTLEDAIRFVKSIGKRYLWIDSICINQADDKDKQAQLELMHLIYRHCWATLVALTGTSADAGLPRVGYPGRPAQLEFTHGRLQLLTVLSTLKQQVSSSPWSKRAWTYQEAVLSPRCLYFTPEQVYFSCNMTQFCESIDENGSAFHQMRYEEVIENLKFDRFTELGYGVFRDPSSTPFSLKVPSRARIYSDILSEYSSRQLTYDSDAYNAIRAVLTTLQNGLFPKGFIWGLPIEGFIHALSHWTSRNTLIRRKEFPSWTWLGWKGALSPISGGVWADGSYCVPPPPLRVSKWDGGELELVYQSTPLDVASDSPTSSRQITDPIIDAASASRMRGHGKGFDLDQLSKCSLSKILFVEGLLFRPKAVPTHAQLAPLEDFKCRLELSRAVLINGILCMVTCDSEKTANSVATDPDGFLFPKRQALLLVRRSTICLYHFLVLDMVEDETDQDPVLKLKAQLTAQRVGSVILVFQEMRNLQANPFQLPSYSNISWMGIDRSIGNFYLDASKKMHTIFPQRSLECAYIALE